MPFTDFNPCRFSPCRKYRYFLTHQWDGLFGWREIAFIGLNPSTADESQLDPTLRRIRGFCLSWGFNTFHMLNLFAFRSPDPRSLRSIADPVGPENDSVLLSFREEGYLWSFVGDRTELTLGAMLRSFDCFMERRRSVSLPRKAGIQDILCISLLTIARLIPARSWRSFRIIRGISTFRLSMRMAPRAIQCASAALAADLATRGLLIDF